MSWSRSLEPYRASWRSGSNPCSPDLNPSSPRSELNDLLPHLGRTELAVILGASASWQGSEGPGHQALLGRSAGQARGVGFERRHSNGSFSCSRNQKNLLFSTADFNFNMSNESPKNPDQALGRDAQRCWPCVGRGRTRMVGTLSGPLLSTFGPGTNFYVLGKGEQLVP